LEEAFMANQLKKIEHIVQLMLENRSFDQMLGFLYESSGNQSPSGVAYEGLKGTESNPDEFGREITVFKIDQSAAHPYLRPGADPGEGFQNTNLQLFSTDAPDAGAAPSNRGFVIDFKAAIASDLSRQFKDTLPDTHPSDIMGMYAPEMLPIMSTLARGYAVCDQWFASVPTQTIPNRAFAAAGTSQGHLDNKVKVFTCPSIFGRLSDKNLDWAIFGYDSAPLTRLDFPDTQNADPTHFGHFRDFQQRAADGTLPPYTFLEPSFGASGNSQHPNYDVALGEKLIHDIYKALHDGPGWSNTLLIITYDEHGGNYDHVPPPSGAVVPDSAVGEFGFDFSRFGVRVPALLISPLIEPATVFRAKKGTIDHTSVLRTIEERWGVNPLTARDKVAPSLGDVLTMATPRTDDVLNNVPIPISNEVHPFQSQPSLLERIHASKVADLPLRNTKGIYGEHTPPDLSSSESIADYIQMRTNPDAHGRVGSAPAPATCPGWGHAVDLVFGRCIPNGPHQATGHCLRTCLFAEFDLPPHAALVSYQELRIAAGEILFDKGERPMRLMTLPTGPVEKIPACHVSGFTPKNCARVTRSRRGPNRADRRLVSVTSSVSL
jgi:phospholipase C